LQLAVAVIDYQMLVEADGAAQHVVQLGVRPGVVLGQLAEYAVAVEVGARIADVADVVAHAAQHHGGQGGGHAGVLAGLAGVGEQPAVGCQQHRVERLGDAPGIGRGVVVGEQVAHRELGRLAAVGMAADAVGDHQQHALAGQLLTFRRGRTDEVFVAAAPPGQRRMGEPHPQRLAGRR
jgi:hypothetical protein